ncbi:hypothetical protein FRC03_010196 [Tulasnella sp. 419]|nr:hypothetical protein FRC03_010196 [Tulasnella sp. 419]
MIKTLESLRQDLVLKIQNTDKIMDQDLRNNNIDRQDLLGQLIFYSRDNLVVYPEETVVATQDVTGVPHLGEHTSEDTPSGAPVVVHVPKHAKDFHDRLVAPLPYRDDDDRVKHRISILEFHLGVVEVKKHIVPAVNGLSWHYFERLDSALSLFCQTQPAYSTNITGLTCEAWCTAPVVDRILVGINNYFRDKSHATIVTENSSGSKTSWKPRNDFVVSYLEDAHGYAVLHGETASTNETADDAS